jgi:putative membrane protein
MQLAADIVVGLIAATHVYFLVLEMFLWDLAVRVFGVPPALRKEKLLRVLFQNQGIYNGFLAAGLVWGLLHADPAFALQLKFFFLGCVAVAGLVGAITAQVRILFIQTAPALLAVVMLGLV